MNSNIGLIDRIIRLIIAGVILYAYYVGWIAGWSAFASGVVAAVMISTALSGDCYLYRMLNISTKLNT